MERGIDGDGLMVVGRGAGSDGAGVAAVLPKEGPHTGPVALRKPARILSQQLVNRIFVESCAGGSAVFDAASCACQETDAEYHETETAQADRLCVSRIWVRSS